MATVLFIVALGTMFFNPQIAIVLAILCIALILDRWRQQIHPTEKRTEDWNRTLYSGEPNTSPKRIIGRTKQ